MQQPTQHLTSAVRLAPSAEAGAVIRTLILCAFMGALISGFILAASTDETPSDAGFIFGVLVLAGSQLVGLIGVIAAGVRLGMR